jgi:hypothetical protein
MDQHTPEYYIQVMQQNSFQKHVHNLFKYSRGQYYDNNFRRFSLVFCAKIGVKTNVIIYFFLHKETVFWIKIVNFSSKSFENHKIDPRFDSWGPIL